MNYQHLSSNVHYRRGINLENEISSLLNEQYHTLNTINIQYNVNQNYKIYNNNSVNLEDQDVYLLKKENKVGTNMEKQPNSKKINNKNVSQKPSIGLPPRIDRFTSTKKESKNLLNENGKKHNVYSPANNKKVLFSNDINI